MLLRLQIVSTGEFLVLADNGVLTVEIQSTLFNNQNDLLGSFSYESTMPLEPNKAMLQNAHLITSSGDLRTFEVRMILSYLPYKLAKLTFNMLDNEVQYHVFIDSGSLANKFKMLKMHELAAPGVDDSEFFLTVAEYKAYMMATITAEPGTMPMVFFPFKNDAAYRDAAYSTDPEVTAGYPDISFPVNKYINGWQTVGGIGSFKMNDGDYSETQMPFFYVTYLLKRICKFFGVTPVGKWLNDPVANRIVFYTNIATSSGFGFPDYLFFMPDINVSEFLKELRTELGLLIDFDLTNNLCYIESFDNLEDAEDTLDLSEMQLAGFRDVGSTLRAYKLIQGTDDKDTAFTDEEKKDLPVVIIGDESTATETTEITLTSVATKMIIELSPAEASTAMWRVPHIKQPINASGALEQLSDYPYSDRNKFKMRFLYWHGMVEDSNGYLYPYGSADNLDRNNNPIAETTLALTNTGTAYNAVKRKYEFMKNSRPIEVSFNFPPHVFASLKPVNRISIKDRNRATLNCLMDVAATDLVNDKTTIFSKIILWPIIRPNNVVQVIPVVPIDPPEPPVDNGTVFARMAIRNVTHTEYPFPPPPYIMHKIDVYVLFFEDAVMTIPKDVTDLSLRIKTTVTTAGDSAGAVVTYYDYVRSSADNEVKLFNQVMNDSNQYGTFMSWEYTLMPTAHYSLI